MRKGGDRHHDRIMSGLRRITVPFLQDREDQGALRLESGDEDIDVDSEISSHVLGYYIKGICRERYLEKEKKVAKSPFSCSSNFSGLPKLEP
jgi:hypothetical protein